MTDPTRWTFGGVEGVWMCGGVGDAADEQRALRIRREPTDRLVVDGNALARMSGFNGPFSTDDLRHGVRDRCQAHGNRLQDEELESNSSSIRFAGAAVRRHSELRL